MAGAGASVADAAATSFTGPAKASSSPTKEEAGEEIPLLDTGHFRPVWVETKLPDVSYKDLVVTYRVNFVFTDIIPALNSQALNVTCNRLITFIRY